MKSRIETLLEAFGVDEQNKRACSFAAISTRPAPSGWKAFTFDLPVLFYHVYAPGGNVTRVRSLALGIRHENYVLLAELDSHVVLVLRRSKKDDKVPLLVPLRREEEYERVVNAVRKFNFVSDMLTAHSSINSVVDLLRAGAERYYTNRGLFSNYFLRERLSGCLSERGRNSSKESARLFSKFEGELPTSAEDALKVLSVLGYEMMPLGKPGYPEYSLKSHAVLLDAGCVVAPVESLDIKTGDKVAPSYQAVAALKRHTWVILTNGRLWRLYSSRVSSASTNYFEVDLEGIVVESDPKLVYFVSLFSSSSLLPRKGIVDLDLVFDGGLRYAKEVEADLSAKVFDGQLFLNLTRAVLGHSTSVSYEQKKLDDAKAAALKLLYRLLFVLYAESRALLPVENARYKEISLESLRQRLSAFEKQPDATSVWTALKFLFSTVSKGNPEASVPQYDGALFDEDPALDTLSIENKHLIPALRDITEVEGRGIDYQNLGVRHLGSLYEALLEYSVRQAEQDLVLYKNEILDAQYAVDLKQKPRGFINQGELYLSVGGLARKRTGSYYTPDEIVKFLVRKGLEPHLKAREEQFRSDLELLRASNTSDPELEKKCTDDLLGLKIVDPAMGSGHFLVTAVDEITRWIIGLLKENPDAPLVREVEEYRGVIVEEQLKKGIRLDEDLLTDNVILKRMVMKRCVYGVDVNPLAVELAKLSLWLDSFTIGTPLTFLDHHIRCGDSLIGLWIENIAPRAFETTLDSWMGTVSTAGTSLFEAVSMPADLTVEQVTQSREAYDKVREKTKPLRVLLDMTCASVIDPELGEKMPRNLVLVEQTCRQSGRAKPKWWANVEEALKLAAKYRFFQWELEFPDAFTKEKSGFDLIVMNPPWDAVKPEIDDFFSVYYPRFRKLRYKVEKQKVMKMLLKDAAISKSYDDYRVSIEQRGIFYKKSKQYEKRGTGDIDLWKLFLERCLCLQAKNGSLAIVIPSGLVTAQGGKQLRQVLFGRRIRAMFEFENRKGIFDIDSRYKFVLLVADKATPTETFPAAFYLHDVNALAGKVEQEKFIDMSVNFVKRASPGSLSIPEARSHDEIDLLEKIYDAHPLLLSANRNLSISLVREDLSLTSTNEKGWQIFEGKNFHQFILDFEKSSCSIMPSEGLRITAKHKKFGNLNRRIHEIVRLAFRGVGRGTDTRTMIAAILPPQTFVARKATLVLPRKGLNFVLDDEYYWLIAYFAGILNSMVFDFLLRKRISINLNYFYLYETPFPDKHGGKVVNRIVEIAALLSSPDERFSEFANVLKVDVGPLSMRERISLLAELNALVAKHYGLTRSDLELVLQSFVSFKEGKELERLKEVKWSDDLIRRLNGEVRKRVLQYFDSLNSQENGVKTK